MEIRQAINLYLTAKAYNDEEFKGKFENSNKNLDECVLYIQYKMFEKVSKEAKKSQVACIMPSDDEVFALAEQYYMDDDLKVDGSEFNNVKIVSAQATAFTDEEKAQMRQEAIKKYQEEVIAELRKKADAKKAKKTAEKKPVMPILVPDVKANDEESISQEAAHESHIANTATKKEQDSCTQLSLF